MIYDHFLAPIYRLIFCRESPRFTRESMRLIAYVERSYLQDNYTYLTIFSETIATHLLPKFVPNRLVLGEIAYQTILQSLQHLFSQGIQKQDCIPYKFSMGHYHLKYLN
jgi:hypothetical protein